VHPALWTPVDLKLEPENTDSTICSERMMLGQLGDLRPDPELGPFLCAAEEQGGMVLGEGVPGAVEA
jgi:hypothetical protein